MTFTLKPEKSTDVWTTLVSGQLIRSRRKHGSSCERILEVHYKWFGLRGGERGGEKETGKYGTVEGEDREPGK
jgi:hypothetical protein